MRRPYFAFIALGIAFIGFAASGRSTVYYGVGVAFIVIGFIIKRRTGTDR